MDPITATIVAIIIMVIGMTALLLVVTRKAYNHKWDTEEEPLNNIQEELVVTQHSDQDNQEQDPQTSR